MATIKEIAAEAGVSRMTVSNVLNNVKGKVSPETEKRIREIMEKHHYVPSMAARSLISKYSHIIGILLPSWSNTPSSLLLNPYAAYLLAYFEELLRAREYYVMLCSFSCVDDVLIFQRVWHTDGMIQLFPHDDSITHQLVEKSSQARNSKRRACFLHGGSAGNFQHRQKTYDSGRIRFDSDPSLQHFF